MFDRNSAPSEINAHTVQCEGTAAAAFDDEFFTRKLDGLGSYINNGVVYLRTCYEHGIDIHTTPQFGPAKGSDVSQWRDRPVCDEGVASPRG